MFGVGAAAGGILGGFLGSLSARIDQRYLPIFMALTTSLGIVPFLALLDDPTYTRAGWRPCLYAFAGGCLGASALLRRCARATAALRRGRSPHPRRALSQHALGERPPLHHKR